MYSMSMLFAAFINVLQNELNVVNCCSNQMPVFVSVKSESLGNMISDLLSLRKMPRPHNVIPPLLLHGFSGMKRRPKKCEGRTTYKCGG